MILLKCASLFIALDQKRHEIGDLNIFQCVTDIIEALQHTSGTNQEKVHSASLLSHVQPEQAGLDKQFLESKILSTCLNIRWCSK